MSSSSPPVTPSTSPPSISATTISSAQSTASTLTPGGHHDTAVNTAAEQDSKQTQGKRNNKQKKQQHANDLSNTANKNDATVDTDIEEKKHQPLIRTRAGREDKMSTEQWSEVGSPTTRRHQQHQRQQRDGVQTDGERDSATVSSRGRGGRGRGSGDRGGRGGRGGHQTNQKRDAHHPPPVSSTSHHNGEEDKDGECQPTDPAISRGEDQKHPTDYIHAAAQIQGEQSSQRKKKPRKPKPAHTDQPDDESTEGEAKVSHHQTVKTRDRVSTSDHLSDQLIHEDEVAILPKQIKPRQKQSRSSHQGPAEGNDSNPGARSFSQRGRRGRSRGGHFEQYRSRYSSHQAGNQQVSNQQNNNQLNNTAVSSPSSSVPDNSDAITEKKEETKKPAVYAGFVVVNTTKEDDDIHSKYFDDVKEEKEEQVVDEVQISDPVDDDNTSSSTTVVVSPYDYSDEQLVAFELLQAAVDKELELVDGKNPQTTVPIHINQTQASILRYNLMQPHTKHGQQTWEIIESLKYYQKDAGADLETSAQPSLAIGAVLDTLHALTQQHLDMEKECHEAQLNEIEALRAIFGATLIDNLQPELYIFQTVPFSLKILVRLEEIDCMLELAFFLPLDYPLHAPLKVVGFIPPPFSDISVDAEDGDGKIIKQELSISLQAELDKHAQFLSDTQNDSIYSLVERAREWMSSHISYLRTSFEKQQRDAAQTDANLHLLAACQSDTVKIIGRGYVEQQISQAVFILQQNKQLTDAQAKLSLKKYNWDVKKALSDDELKPNAQTSHLISIKGAVEADSSDLPSTSENTLKRQDSQQERAIHQTLVNTYRQYIANSLVAPKLATLSEDDDASLTLTCVGCFEGLQLREMLGLACGHTMCRSCWGRMLSGAIAQGQCYLRCPANSKCVQYVEEGIFVGVLSQTLYLRYRRWLENSYVQLSGLKSCSNPRCDLVSSSKEPYAAIQCHCGAMYCFACDQDAHWPITCNTARSYLSSKVVRKLREKVMTVSANKAETLKIDGKNCPKCKTMWEKNGGCNHFTCGACGHHFCFVCLQDWSLHGVSYFECMFKDKAKKATKIYFSADDAIEGELGHITNYCLREVHHYSSYTAYQKLLADESQLNTLSQILPQVTSASNLVPLIRSAMEAHSMLQGTYILLSLHARMFASHRLTESTTKLLQELNQFEYFIDSVDHTFIPFVASLQQSKVPRSRSFTQLKDTISAAIKYCQLFSASLQQFKIRQEAKGTSEDELAEQFFQQIDQALRKTLADSLINV